MPSVYRKLEVLSTTRKMRAGVLLFQGGVYGALRGKVDGPDVLGGVAYGTALWLVGDGVAAPMLGLQEGPVAYPLGEPPQPLAGASGLRRGHGTDDAMAAAVGIG